MRFPELGIYLLPGHSDRPADVLDEVRAAEALGLGSAWISERFDQFDAGADGVILHASLPHEVAPAVEAWAKLRPAERFRGRSARPA